MSDKLIEAVARALVIANFAATKQVPTPRAVDHYVNSYKLEALAVFAAIEASGYAVVPKEATEEMIKALNEYAECAGYIPDGYVAMLAAAPKID